MRKDIEFNSCGVKCRGWLFTPDKGKGPFPCIVFAGGGGYVKEFPIMVGHAEQFMQYGMASIVFDYRGYGSSEGTPRLHLDPWAQIEDCRNALSLAETLPEIDPNRLGVWGISIGGGHAFALPAVDPRVKCSVGVVPVVDGYTGRRITRGDIWVERALKASLEDRRKRFNDDSKRGYVASYVPDSSKEMASFPYPGQYDVFMNLKKTVPQWENSRTVESLENMINYSVEPYLRRLVNTPLMAIVVEGDTNCTWDLAIEFHNRVPSPRKKLVILPSDGGALTHLSMYSDATHLKSVSQPAAEYLAQYLVKA